MAKITPMVSFVKNNNELQKFAEVIKWLMYQLFLVL
jgi:hypothetical protein